jgi:hypothetical protein
MFTATEITELRLQSEAAMVDTAHVRTVSAKAVDDLGGFSGGTPATIQVPCRVGSVSRGDEREAASRLQAVAEAVLVVPVSTAEIPMDATVTVAFARGGIGSYQVAGFVPMRTHAIDRRYLLKQAVS